MKELLSDTPIEDSVIMVQKGSNTVSRFCGGLPWIAVFSQFCCICRKPSLSSGIEVRGDLTLTEKLDALPPKKKRMRNLSKFRGSDNLEREMCRYICSF